MNQPAHPFAGSFLNKAHNPFLQAGIAAALTIFFVLVTEALKAVFDLGFSQRTPWVIATSFLLLYAVLNSVFCLATQQAGRYWNRSILAYVGLGLVSAGLAWIVSGIPLSEAGSFKWLFIVVTFSYLVFISIVNIMRQIVHFAQREEWHAPRQRGKRRRR